MSAVIDIVAARLHRERIYESGRTQGWLEARRHYLKETSKRNWGDWLEGAVIGAAVAALAMMFVRAMR